MNINVVEYFGRDDDCSECGYCKQKGSLNHGMWVHELSCQNYEDLINRGWRRSGKYCYKPIMQETCCPQYPIRCNVAQFNLSHSQKKVLRRISKYIKTGERKHSASTLNTDIDEGLLETSCQRMETENVQPRLNDLQGVQPIKLQPETHKQKGSLVESTLNNIHKDGKNRGKEEVVNNNKELYQTAVPSFRPSKKKKNLRKERKIKKLEAKAEKLGKTANELWEEEKKLKSTEKSLADFVEDIDDSKHKLTVKLVLVNPESQEFKQTYEMEYEIYKKYQITIHGDPPKDVTEKQFQRFLINGPLEHEPASSTNSYPSTGLGSFHQQYYIDGRLIAVGVLDILPTLISSKYFFYDPDYRFLSLGTYSALREIYFTQQLQKSCEQLKHYCMGFYVHSCQKMRYKGNFSASYLLCPETYTWHSIEKCKDKLDKSKYSRFEEDPNIHAEEADVNKTMILFNRRIFTYKIWASILGESDKEKQDSLVREYTQLAGQTAHNILLYRDVSVLTSPCALTITSR